MTEEEFILGELDAANELQRNVRRTVRVLKGALAKVRGKCRWCGKPRKDSHYASLCHPCGVKNAISQGVRDAKKKGDSLVCR